MVAYGGWRPRIPTSPLVYLMTVINYNVYMFTCAKAAGARPRDSHENVDSSLIFLREN